MTAEFGTAPTLRSYLALARRRKWWIAGAALLGLAVSLALSVSRPDQYSATAQLLVQPSGASTAYGGRHAAVSRARAGGLHEQLGSGRILIGPGYGQGQAHRQAQERGSGNPPLAPARERQVRAESRSSSELSRHPRSPRIETAGVDVATELPGPSGRVAACVH